MMTTPRETPKSKYLKDIRIPEYCMEYQVLLDKAEETKDNLGAYLAFSWVPDPARYRSTDVTKQYEALLQNVLLRKEMDRVFNDYCFVPEVTKQGNIHIHGYYAIKDRVKYFRWFLPACRSWGYVYIKDNIDKQWTLGYMSKECDWMADILAGYHTVILPHIRAIQLLELEIKDNGHILKHTPKRKVYQQRGILKYI